MAKSTVAQALASLQFKFQDKIREVGQLKKQISEGNNANVEIQRLRLRIDNDAVAFDRLTSTLRLVEFRAVQAEQAYKRLQSHTQDVDGVVKDLKADVSSWKSFTAVGIILGAAAGALGMLAYIVQTSPL